MQLSCWNSRHIQATDYQTQATGLYYLAAEGPRAAQLKQEERWLGSSSASYRFSGRFTTMTVMIQLSVSSSLDSRLVASASWQDGSWHVSVLYGVTSTAHAAHITSSRHCGALTCYETAMMMQHWEHCCLTEYKQNIWLRRMADTVLQLPSAGDLVPGDWILVCTGRGGRFFWDFWGVKKNPVCTKCP